MGGRGSGSGRTPTTSSTLKKARTVGHLADDFVGFNNAVDALMAETGLSRDVAQKTYDAMYDYFGAYYSSIRKGKPPSAATKAKLIDAAIKKSRNFEGQIYRGISLSQSEYAKWSKQLQKGGQIDMGGVSSWSSKKSVAENFADKGSSLNQSIIFTVAKTKSASPVQHLSHYGKGEAEVLAPSSTKYKINSFKTEGRKTYITLAEVG